MVISEVGEETKVCVDILYPGPLHSIAMLIKNRSNQTAGVSPATSFWLLKGLFRLPKHSAIVAQECLGLNIICKDKTLWCHFCSVLLIALLVIASKTPKTRLRIATN
jgi:hypothetical protein